MRGSAAFRAAIAPGGVLAGPWVKNSLWRTARAVPSLDQPFADTKSLVDAVTGQSLVTFTRASSGTSVGSDGVLRTAVTNLLLRSEEFDNAYWTKSGATVSADQTASPIGSVTADKLIESAANSEHWAGRLSLSLPSAIYTCSIYAKAAERQSFSIFLDTSATRRTAYFNLSNGTLGAISTGITSSIQNIGNGWYRCSITLNAAESISNAVYTPAIGNSNLYLGDGTSGIYVWGAQLEASSTVGEYIPTTSTINSAPRFDHNPATGESLGLLVEEQRTNSIRNNTMVGAVAGTPGTLPTNWVTVLNGLTQTVVGAGSSNGINYIDIRFNGTTTSAGFIQIKPDGNAGAISASAAQAWVMSSWMAIVGGSTANTTSQQFLLNEYSTGPAYLRTATLASNTLSGGASLTRVSGAITTGASTTIIEPLITLGHNSGAAIDITLRIGMPQLELGAFPTSVIPTTGAAATRSADVASITGANFSSWYRQDEGTVFADLVTTSRGYSAYPRLVGIFGSNIDASNEFAIYTRNIGTADDYKMYGVVTDGSVAGDFNPPASTPVGSGRVALSAKQNDGAFTVNGLTPVTDNTLNMPTSATQLLLFSNARYQPRTSGTIRRLTYWPQRLPNSTIQALTQ